MLLIVKYLTLFVLICVVNQLEGGHVITTPRKWTAKEASQVCVTSQATFSSQDSVRVTLATVDIPSENLVERELILPQGEKSNCNVVFLPDVRHHEAILRIAGSLAGTKLDYSKTIDVVTKVDKTFVQTDKFLYKPGQKVQFRILTVGGPYLKISKEQYEEIWVENPSGTRIHQWLNVTNGNGLIHQEFTLADEPEEGTYKINVQGPTGGVTSQTFKVEEYVLPRYEVTIKSPPYILGTSDLFSFTVCAKYTFGQPVKGNVTFAVDNNGWGNYKKYVKKEGKISGCHKFDVNATEIDINGENYFAYVLKANADVIEEGTDVKLTAKEASVDVTRTALVFKDVGLQEVYKPELPYIGEVLATLPNERPAANEAVSVCVGQTCKNLTTNDHGIVKFVIPPHLHNESSIQIRSLNYPQIKSENSWRSIMYESSFHKTVKKYHSPSNSSLIVSLSDEKLDCPNTDAEINLNLPVQFAATGIDSATVTVQVISRGQIQFSKTFDQPITAGSSVHLEEGLLLEPMREPATKDLIRGQFTVPVNLPKTISPNAKVIIWYSRPDGEVVSESRSIDVSECLLNTVNMTWSAKKVQPGESATLSIAAEPFSLCSLGVVDKSVRLLSAKKNPLTVASILDIAQKSSVSQHERSQVDDFEYCRNKTADQNPEMPPLLPPVALPSPTRAKRSFHPWFPFHSIDIDALHMFDKAGMYVLSDLELESRPCERRYVRTDVRGMRFGGVADYDGLRFAGYALMGKENKRIKNKKSKRRTYFPETWLWQLKFVTESGKIEEHLILPDTVTEWVADAVCVHDSKGVGLSGPSSITTFRDFFIDLTLPPSVKRGEVFPVKISVFNYLEEPLPLIVTLEESAEYDILSASGDEIGSGDRRSCLPAQDKAVHEVRIRPKAVGKVNITVSAAVDANAIETCGHATGKLRTDLLIKPIQVEIEGFLKEKVWSNYVCTQDLETDEGKSQSWVLETPPDIIPDSARGFITAVGDLMGPTLENLGSLVKMPYGCGEQNMLNFAPNIFVMQYLEASNQANEEIASNAIQFMEKGYQRELNYRHSDGSFSAFGERDDSGSTWLTAFVLKSFAQARSYVSIDASDIDVSREWLKRKQLENGCFESVGKVLHKGMKGGLSGSSSPALLSSFVLIALIESGESTSNKAVREALFCLNAEQPTRNPYSVAVKAYALALTESPDAADAIRALLALATDKGGNMYWEMPAEYESSEGVGVETAGYAILALLTHSSRGTSDYDPQIKKIVKWMNKQRNGQGGFVSTQDTIVALQALAAFEKSLPGGPVDLSVIASMPEGEHLFTVNEQNKLLQQRATLQAIPTTVTFDVIGQGCALVQAVLRYNIPEAEPKQAFNLTVEATTEPDSSCKTKRIKSCASYTLPDLKSNMAIFEINLVSGYIPDKSDLKQIVGYGTGLFKRYEVDGSKVTIYVDEFSPKELCVSFKILREVDVENPKAGNVKVYDYYKPEYTASQKYVLPPSDDCLTDRDFHPVEDEIITDDEAAASTPPQAEGANNDVEGDALP